MPIEEGELFVAPRDHRIDAHGTACRGVASCQRNDGWHDHHDCKGFRVSRLDFKEEARHQPREGNCTGDPDRDAKAC